MPAPSFPILETGLGRLLVGTLGNAAAEQTLLQLHVVPPLWQPVGVTVSRGELAQALNMVLFRDLLARVPEGAAYVADCQNNGHQVVFDHGAARTVAGATGALPAGEAAITRVLRPLGYRLAETYPLPKLRMTGRSWRHADWPEDIAQFFVSELHPEKFSAGFQSAVSRVVGTSRDPVGPADVAMLETLSRDKVLPWDAALALLPTLVCCFERQHPVFSLGDYEILKNESAEMAWIATEGTAFNHATDRVTDIESVATAQRTLGRSIRESIEISDSGRVQQTAFQASRVQRRFLHEGEIVTRTVPGSFYEFIQRGRVASAMDLGFDAANATGIFKMTAGCKSEVGQGDCRDLSAGA